MNRQHEWMMEWLEGYMAENIPLAIYMFLRVICIIYVDIHSIMLIMHYTNMIYDV